MQPLTLCLGPYAPVVRARLAAWRAADVPRRLLAHDASLWTSAGATESAADPISGRLGWLDLPTTSGGALSAWHALADAVRADGVGHVLLLGMGGSSLGAEMLVRSLPHEAGAPELIVCDSTHPAFIAALEARLDLAKTVVVAASKSGTTVETTAHLAYWWARLSRAVPDPGARCVAITDAGTSLADLARSRGFRACVVAPQDVGGRFSVLGPFGLVPALLAGVDAAPIVAGAVAARSALVAAADGGHAAPGRNADEGAFEWAVDGLRLGAALGELALAGRNKLIVDAHAPFDAVAGWLEQLIGESLGKAGRGLFLARAGAGGGAVGADRVAVHIGGAVEAPPSIEGVAASVADGAALVPAIGQPLATAHDLGAALFAWEVATAAAAIVLGVQPFDQPDVEAAKRLARAALAAPRSPRPPAAAGVEPRPVAVAPPRAAELADVVVVAEAWLDRLPADAAVALQAYLPPSRANDIALDALARSIAERTGAAVAWGYGPRYLHSTGQLHKGGPEWVRCIQLVDAAPAPSNAVAATMSSIEEHALALSVVLPGDLPVPDTDLTFGALIAAQAAGDATALAQAGRPPLVVVIGAT